MISLVLSLLPGTLLISLAGGGAAVLLLAGGALGRDSEPEASTLDLVDDRGITHRVEALS